jgi:hypothetical protein
MSTSGVSRNFLGRGGGELDSTNSDEESHQRERGLEVVAP